MSTNGGSLAMHPLVSIIIPSYNRRDLVGETIESALSQDYPNLEVIVLDDGSKDDTVSLLETFGDRIQWSRHENMGETRTVNRGLQMASGEILSILSSDDLFLPGVVRQAVELLERSPEVVGTYCDWVWIDERGTLLQFVQRPEHELTEVLRHSENLPGPGAFFRRSAVQAIGGGRDTDFRYVADFDFWLRMALVGEIRRVPGYGSAFREHSQSTTVAQRNTAVSEEMFGVVEKFYQRPDLPPEVLAIKKEAIAAAHFTAGCAAGIGNFSYKLRHFVRAFPHISNYRRGRAVLELMQEWGPMRALKQFLIRRIRQGPGVGRHYSSLNPTSQSEPR